MNVASLQPLKSTHYTSFFFQIKLKTDILCCPRIGPGDKLIKEGDIRNINVRNNVSQKSISSRTNCSSGSNLHASKSNRIGLQALFQLHIDTQSNLPYEQYSDLCWPTPNLNIRNKRNMYTLEKKPYFWMYRLLCQWKSKHLASQNPSTHPNKIQFVNPYDMLDAPLGRSI